MEIKEVSAMLVAVVATMCCSMIVAAVLVLSP
jgi:hypothetical protein